MSAAWQFVRTTPIRAFQYDGTKESADRIASGCMLSVSAHHEGLVAVFRVPSIREVMVDEWDRETREFGVSPGIWVWWDEEANQIGAEWDDYFRKHYAPAAHAEAGESDG